MYLRRSLLNWIGFAFPKIGRARRHAAAAIWQAMLIFEAPMEAKLPETIFVFEKFWLFFPDSWCRTISSR